MASRSHRRKHCRRLNPQELRVCDRHEPFRIQDNGSLNLNRKSYECPPGTGDKLKPVDQEIGELQVTLKSVRAQLRSKLARLKQLDAQYPGHTAQARLPTNTTGYFATAGG